MSSDYETEAYDILMTYDKEELVFYLLDIMSFEGMKELCENYREVNGNE